MEWRGVTTTNVYIGNFFFVAGLPAFPIRYFAIGKTEYFSLR